MKIKKLNIASYKHLQDISFDFTYPSNHKDAGKPLKKICIIGQSATGKTTILELIKQAIRKLESAEIINGIHLFQSFHLSLKGELEFDSIEGTYKVEETRISINDRVFSNLPDMGGGAVQKLITENLKLLYISSELISKEAVNILNQSTQQLSADPRIPDFHSLRRKSKTDGYIYEFNQELNTAIWFYLIYDILEYRQKFTQLASELINKGLIGNAKKLGDEYERWAQNNKNPLLLFSEKFNQLLNIMNLEVDLINTEFIVPIKSLYKDEIIPIADLSTGTKSLLLSLLPLFALDTSESIILIDEPERSLFPDLQIKLIEYYQKIAPEAQFIVVTHSPFIAAAFEPDERFIMFFNDEGKVSIKKGCSPIGDDPNDILRNDFNIDYNNEFGKEAYQRYLDLKRKITNETDDATKKKLIIQIAELGDKYNF